MIDRASLPMDVPGRLTFCTVDAVTVLVPNSLTATLDALAAEPEAVLLAGGTDLMVELNEGRRRLSPDDDATVVVLTRVPELSTWSIDPGSRTLTLGAGVTWSEIEREPLRSMVPALAEAARTVGSPQIRNAGTVGGNLATCSPAGDGLPVLAALDADVQLVGVSGRRTMSVHDFMVGVKQTALAPGELIESVGVPVLDGWQGYSKVGVRNAMVIATASACVAVDPAARSLGIALGSVAPTVIRCPDAEQLVARRADWDQLTLADDDVAEAGAAAAASSRPIDDHRSTATYRRHAVDVMVRRLLRRAFDDPEGGQP